MENYLWQQLIAHCRYSIAVYKSFKTFRGRASFIAGACTALLVYALVGYGLYRLIF